MKVVLHDGMSVVRARLERDMARFSLSAWLSELDASKDLHIWVWDGANNKALRQEIYPPYKANRVPADSSIYEGIRLFRRALEHTTNSQVCVPGYEADDAIAAIIGRYAGALPIHIDTRDYDLRALVTLADNITCEVKAKLNIDDADIRLYKAFVGDPSDNVKGIAGFGNGAWELCSAHSDRLLDLIHGPLDDAALEILPQQRHRTWLRENQATLQAMWKVVGFFPIAPDLLDANLIKGVSNSHARSQLLAEYFL